MATCCLTLRFKVCSYISAGSPSEGFNSPSGIPNTTDDAMAKSFTRELPKTKAERRETLAEAVRNTQPEPKRQSKSKRDPG